MWTHVNADDLGACHLSDAENERWTSLVALRAGDDDEDEDEKSPRWRTRGGPALGGKVVKRPATSNQRRQKGVVR